MYYSIALNFSPQQRIANESLKVSLTAKFVIRPCSFSPCLNSRHIASSPISLTALIRRDRVSGSSATLMLPIPLVHVGILVTGNLGTPPPVLQAAPVAAAGSLCCLEYDFICRFWPVCSRRVAAAHSASYKARHRPQLSCNDAAMLPYRPSFGRYEYLSARSSMLLCRALCGHRSVDSMIWSKGSTVWARHAMVQEQRSFHNLQNC